MKKQADVKTAASVACYQCGANVDAAKIERIERMVAGKRTATPMCHRCATANRAAQVSLGGVYLQISWGANRAARRHPQVAPVVTPAKTRRPTRGERRQAKKRVQSATIAA